jgi:hypothetical protein
MRLPSIPSLFNDGTDMTIDNIPTCRWCGHTHGDLCPQVKAYTLDDRDMIVRVEFFAPNDHVHPELLEAARKIIGGKQ